MKLKVLLVAVASIVLMTGCVASGRVVRLSDAKVTGPRIIALDAPSAPWVIEIQKRLQQTGFRVLRWGSNTRVSEQTSRSRVESYNEATARFVLVINGYAPHDGMNRCFGGGYKFDHISADLVDTATNETVLNVNGAGYSENCPPMSGTIFGDIADAVDAAWAKS